MQGWHYGKGWFIEMLAYNKSTLCRSASTAFSFVLCRSFPHCSLCGRGKDHGCANLHVRQAPVRLYLSAALWPFQVLHISIYNAQRKNEKMNFITACVADFLTLVGKTSGKQRWYPCSGHRRTPRSQYRRWVRISLQPNWPWQIYNVFCFFVFLFLTGSP